jgi:hypothetical protein
MVHGSIAAEIQASDPERRSWVIVYPPNPAFKQQHFEIKRFEMSTDLMELANSSIQIDDSELVNFISLSVNTLEEVSNILNDWHIPLESFNAPWRVDYPLPVYGP